MGQKPHRFLLPHEKTPPPAGTTPACSTPVQLARPTPLPQRPQRSLRGRCARPVSVLVVVADAQGLSYYSDATIARLLRWDTLQLASARRQLIDADLVAFTSPLYQVLSLDPLDPPAPRIGTALSVGDILRRALAKGGTP